MQNNKVCVMIGGRDIIYSPLAREMANSGYVTAIIDADMERAQRIADEICTFGGLAKAYYAEASDKDALEAVRSSVVAEFGGCHVLINNAGLCLENVNKYEQNVNSSSVDFTQILVPAQVFGAKLKDTVGGAILNLCPIKIGSDNGFADRLENLTRKMAVNLCEVGIRVNTVIYGHTVSGIRLDDAGDERINEIPMQRAAKPREIIGAVKFLTDAVSSSYITGEIIHVDGGYAAKRSIQPVSEE